MATRRLKRPRDPVELGKLIGDILTGQVEDRDSTARNDGRIKKLRHEAVEFRNQAEAKDKLADLLDEELRAYRLVNPDASESPKPMPVPDAPPDQRKGGRQIMPGSKTDQIIALVRSSGSRGLKIGEIISGVSAMGLEVQPSSLRGLVWAQKQAGRFIASDDRYYTPENDPHLSPLDKYTSRA